MKQDWQPLCNKQAIITRNFLYQIIRNFFAQRKVLEVETPLLASSTVTDPFITSFEVKNPSETSIYYLQTSPESAMKKLLCHGMPCMYQICKSFRAEEQGQNHNREFTMLEWYRLGYKLEDLMQEMQDLLHNIFDTKPECQQISYTELFFEYLGFDHNIVDIGYLKKVIEEKYENQFDSIIYHREFDSLYNKDDLLMLLMTHYIEPQLDKQKIYFLYDYPASQSALARVESDGSNLVAKRFEVYYQGFELANGYYELADSDEQEIRFKQDLNRRQQLNLPMIQTDQGLISALSQGLPECSGVAMGLDRILMILLETNNIEDVLTFR